MKTKKSWKEIAKNLYERMGCGCCADYDALFEAKTQYRDKLKSEPLTNKKEK